MARQVPLAPPPLVQPPPPVPYTCTPKVPINVRLQVDSNGNGSLDSREIEVLLNSLTTDALGEGRRVSKAEIRNVMEKVDSNRDRRIAFDEFIRVGLCTCVGWLHALLHAQSQLMRVNYHPYPP